MASAASRSTGQLVGLTGAIGSGKSKVAAYLSLMYNGVTRSFASPLKQIAISFGFTESQIYGTQEQKKEINELWGISGREFMQKLGTEVFRESVPQIMPQLHDPWRRIMEAKARKLINDGTFVIVDDVRFDDEAIMIIQLKGILIRIVRDMPHSQPHSQPHDDKQIKQHASEQQDFEVNFTIINNGTLDELYDQVDKIMATLDMYAYLPRSHRDVY
jgi:dephospho-CoA kinase